jgi:GNAT superfamily N-acetyltransferase
MLNYDVESKMVRPSITPFYKGLILKDFNCGNDEVNKFLKEKAFAQERDKITKIYAIQIKNRVIAYSALFCSHYYLELPDQTQSFRVPGICVGQLGVDIQFQGKGLGSLLIKHSISLANRINDYAACRIIYCEAFDNAIDFYKKHSFLLVEPQPDRNRMYFDLKI